MKVSLLLVSLCLVACSASAAGQPTPDPQEGPDSSSPVTDSSSGVSPVWEQQPDASDVPSGDSGGADVVSVPCGKKGSTLCGVGDTCEDTADCEKGVCTLTHRCASAMSCVGAKGADEKCTDGDCCASIAVPGGTFENVDNDTSVETATVPGFRLDRYEVTVGRMRAFVTAFGGDLRGHPPLPGAGAKPSVPGSGWRSSFNARLPGSTQEVNDRLTWACAVGGNNNDYGAATWTPEPGPNEDKPINCVDWYTLFAFCAWDGGRLPSDAEWSYVALSGDEKRVYPFGNEAPTWTTHNLIFTSRLPDPAIPGTSLFTQGPMYRGATDGPLPIAPVGLKTERSKWGHADVTGNVIEQTLERAAALVTNCNDCANVTWPDPPQVSGYPRDWKLPGSEFSNEAAANDGIRLARGSSWQGEQGGHWMKNTRNRFWLPVWRTYSAMGGRCARDL